MPRASCDGYNSFFSFIDLVYSHACISGIAIHNWCSVLCLITRYLLCRPLPLDVGRCACYIVREREGSAGDGPIVYSLYTDVLYIYIVSHILAMNCWYSHDCSLISYGCFFIQEGHGRQDRKLAVARHRWRSGRSEFVISQHGARTFLGSKCEEGLLGQVTANIVGSRYSIWDEVYIRTNPFIVQIIYNNNNAYIIYIICPCNKRHLLQMSSSERKYQGCRHQLGVVMYMTIVDVFSSVMWYVEHYDLIDHSLIFYLNQVWANHNYIYGCL